jgi:MOSC domain-containing protein YiiM
MSGRLFAIARKARKRAPMEELERTLISAQAGIAGDYRGRPGRRQVTILLAEDWKAATAGLCPAAPWTIRRANLLVEGVSNPRAAGGMLSIGPVMFLITGETEPCFRMDEQLPGLQEALRPNWRGGLTAQVMSDGDIEVGDVAEWVSRP